MKNKKKFSHFSKSERSEITILRKKNYTIREIALELRRAPSAIYYEFQRNKVKGIYDSTKAHIKTAARRRAAWFQWKRVAHEPELKKYVEKYLYDDYSPEEIAGRLKNVDKHLSYASNTIFN